MKLEVTDKFSRQFKLFYLFFHFRVLEYMDLNQHIKVSLKTTQRDVKDLTDAGLINVYFSKRENGYTWYDWEDREDMIYTMCCLPPPRLVQNQARNRHLKKLNRLANIVLFIENEDIPFYEKLGYEEDWEYLWAMEEPEDYLSCHAGFPKSNDNKQYYTYVDWYQETFPDCSRSTMYRDFKDLRRLGLTIGYNAEFKYYHYDFCSFYND